MDGWHSLPFFALCLVCQGLPRNVDDSSGLVPLGTAFLPPLPSPGCVFFEVYQDLTFYLAILKKKILLFLTFLNMRMTFFLVFGFCWNLIF